MMNQSLVNKKEIISFFLEKGILIGSDFLDNIDNAFDINYFYKLILDKINSKELLIINKDLKHILGKITKLDLNWYDLEKFKVLSEKKKDGVLYNKFIEYILNQEEVGGGGKRKGKEKENSETIENKNNVKILFNYKKDIIKKKISDFIGYFNVRFNSIEKILQTRQELKNLTSINRILNKKDREEISLIGMVSDKQITKNNNFILTMEDKTGIIKVLINKNKPEIYDICKDVVLDEILGIVGVNGEGILFVNNLIQPGFPQKEFKKKKKEEDEEEEYAVFLSDLHVGSTYFLKENFDRFIKWTNGQLGNEKQKEIQKKVKYIFIIGDLVDGVGIYPEQDSELEIKDIYEQYKECARLLKLIPKHIPIIICPGNHDANRIAEPQLELSNEYAEPIWQLHNTIMVSNPAYVNIASSNTFSGFDVLMYHGYSFDYYVREVESIKANGGYNRPDLIMKFLLQRRHLAPTHGSTLYIPDTNKDPLFIDKIPDFFITGHIHKSSATNYKNVTLICGSCWQSKTIFQERVGHIPEPCRVPIVNLNTRELKILKF